MISILTPAHKVIPWWNLRLVNICSLGFKDWEWVILDNSEDGCVSDYVDKFFSEMQGSMFPECRDKIKVFHDPFSGVGIADGRIGKLKNRCVELSSCRDDEFFVVFDFDDFLIDGFLDSVDVISCRFPDVGFVTGMFVGELCQFIDDGSFIVNSFIYDRFYGVYDDNHISDLVSYGCDRMNGFREYTEMYTGRDYSSHELCEFPSYITFPGTDNSFYFTNAIRMTEPPLFCKTYSHPHVFRKGLFLEKMGGFCETLPNEDVINLKVPYMFKTMYINAPCYVQVAVVDRSGMRVSGTIDVMKADNSEFRKRNKMMHVECCWERYNAVGGNMMNPIPFEYFYPDRYFIVNQ